MLVATHPDPCGRPKPIQGSKGRLCAWLCEVGVVPGQEPQVHRARTQAAGACAGHVCAQLRVLAGGTPRAPLRPLSALLCSSAAGGRVVSRLRARASPPAGIGSGRPQRGSLPGGRSRIGSRYRRGWVGVGRGGRQAIHLLLLQRNGAARAPAHLSSASFADNGHLSSLSSANVISTADGGRGAHAHGPAGHAFVHIHINT